MEPRSRETTPEKEDLDFIVDDYDYDDDPDYEPDENVIIATKFEMETRTTDYSKKINFGLRI